MDKYSQGICHDGAAILKDGAMMTVDDVVAELNRIAELKKLNTELVDKGNHYIVDNSRLAKENQRLRDAARDAVREWREVIRGDFDGVTGGNTDDVTERLGTLLGVVDE